MAVSSELRKTRRFTVGFASISILLTGISIASLLFLELTMNKLADSMYTDVYVNAQLIQDSAIQLQHSALILTDALDQKTGGVEITGISQEFHGAYALGAARIGTVIDNIGALSTAYSGGESGRRLLSGLITELEQSRQFLEEWGTAGQRLMALPAAGGVAPQSLPLPEIRAGLDQTLSHLDRSAQLLDDYAQQTKLDYAEQKTALFTVHIIVLLLLVLANIYLGRRLVMQRKDLLQEQSLYQLIGERMSDFILLTDQNGVIQYASPSHAGVLGYIPEQGVPLTNYIREAEASWAKLMSLVQDIPRIAELRMRAKEGHWVWLETKVSTIDVGALPVHFMLVSREISQRKQHEERLHKLAFYDHLTAIPNRAHFKMYMENLITQPDDHRQEVALALLDCDRFKQLNDTLGHLAGDEFLQLLSRELQQTVKGVGQAFRFGGDEFAVVFHRYGSLELLNEQLNRLLRLFSKSWSVNGGASFRTSASIGVALYPQHGSDINELLRAADLSMYRSKQNGGNEACLYNELVDEQQVSDQRN